MSAYEDDLAAERVIFDTVERGRSPRIEEEQAASGVNSGGRPFKVDPIKLVAWRQARKASIPETAKRWGVSVATVKRLSRTYGEAAKKARVEWEVQQLDRELRQHEYDLRMMYLAQRNRHLGWVEFLWFGRCLRAQGTDQEAAVEAARDAAMEDAAREFQAGWERLIGPLSQFGP